MQHGFYQAWKHGTLVHTLKQARIEAPVEPLVDAHGDGRRRVTLHVRFPDRAMHVGFMAPRSHQIVEIAFCPIAEPALKDRAPAIARAIGEHLKGPRKPLDVQITATQTGFDVDVRGHGPMKDADRLRLIDLADRLDLSRLSIHGDVIVERRPPAILMGRTSVVPPPGSFLQATKLGEDVLAGLVTEACAKAKRVADLFAGAGPFSLRLAEKSEVHAVEFDKDSMTALDKAVRATPGLRRVTTEARDLFRRPLLTPELNAFDAVVLDPPRAGAEAQVKQLAVSKVPLVVSVSCDAATFARDAAILIERRLPPGARDPGRSVQALPASGGRRDPAAGRGEEAAVIQIVITDGASAEVRDRFQNEAPQALSPLVGGELERGVQRRTGTSRPPAPRSLALPHKEGGE